jgi:hypothetical protein
LSFPYFSQAHNQEELFIRKAGFSEINAIWRLENIDQNAFLLPVELFAEIPNAITISFSQSPYSTIFCHTPCAE